MVDVPLVATVHPMPQPLCFAFAHPALERRQVVAEHVFDGDQTVAREPGLELGADERNVRQRARAQKRFFCAGLDNHDPAATCARLGAVDRHLRDELVRPAADRKGEPSRVPQR